MTPRLAVLTPDPADRSYAGRQEGLFERYAAALRTVGIEAFRHPWSEAPPEAGAQTPLLAWGYHHHQPVWTARLAAAGPPMINPARTLLWNTCKTYLFALEADGVPIIPTLAANRMDEAMLASAFERFGADTLVIKPQVSAGSFATALLNRGEAPPAHGAPVLIQPFLPAVASEGELSLLYFGGRLGHAVRKVAAAGDFRVQPQFGGRVSAFTPDAEATGLAEAVLRAAPGPLAYARIDLVRHPDGTLRLMEIEAIEPDLYLGHATDGGKAFAAAMRSAMEAVRS